MIENGLKILLQEVSSFKGNGVLQEYILNIWNNLDLGKI